MSVFQPIKWGFIGYTWHAIDEINTYFKILSTDFESVDLVETRWLDNRGFGHIWYPLLILILNFHSS